MIDVSNLQALAPVTFSSPLAGAALAVLLTATAVPVLAFLRLCATRDKLMNANLARQMFVLGCLLSTLTGFAGLLWLARMPRMPEALQEAASGFSLGFSGYIWWHTPLRFNVILLGLICIALIVLCYPLAYAWKRLDASPLKIWSGSIALVVLMPALWGTLIPLLRHVPFPAGASALLGEGSSLFLLAGILLGAAIGLGGGAGFIWTLLRRDKNESPPGYETFALHAESRMGTDGSLIMLAGLVALRISLNLPVLPGYAVLALVLPAVAALLFSISSRDMHPRRRAVFGLCGALLLVAGVMLLTHLLCLL